MTVLKYDDVNKKLRDLRNYCDIFSKILISNTTMQKFIDRARLVQDL